MQELWENRCLSTKKAQFGIVDGTNLKKKWGIDSAESHHAWTAIFGVRRLESDRTKTANFQWYI